MYDLNRDGMKLVVGELAGAGRRLHAHGVPQPGLTSALRNVVSQESDVRDVLGKVALGRPTRGSST